MLYLIKHDWTQRFKEWCRKVDFDNIANNVEYLILLAFLAIMTIGLLSG